MMERRTFLVMISGGLLAAPHAAEAQQAARVPRIGILVPGAPSPPGAPPLPAFEAFRQGLRDLGYVEGQSIVLETRWEEGKVDRYPELVRDLLRLKVEVILAAGMGAERTKGSRCRHRQDVLPFGREAPAGSERTRGI